MAMRSCLSAPDKTYQTLIPTPDISQSDQGSTASSDDEDDEQSEEDEDEADDENEADDEEEVQEVFRKFLEWCNKPRRCIKGLPKAMEDLLKQFADLTAPLNMPNIL